MTKTRVTAAPLTYGQALAALAERGRFGIRLGLGRTRALLRELDHPERTVRGALIAGTNGKGSVLALADAALRAAGYRVGSTPKPHLVSYRERVAVDGRPIAADDFARLVARVLAAADRIAARHGEPTEFELLTAVVFAHFAEVRPDVALVEVGLGGRLDATHAWDGGVAVVTNVDLDHMDRLGDTITAIAREKAAIIERGDRAVTGARGDGLAVVRRRARRLGVPLTEVDPAGRSSAGTATASRWTCRSSARPASACAAGTRPSTRRSPMRRSTLSKRPASRPCRPRRGGPATPPRPGPAASSCCASVAATSSSTGPTTRPARPPWRSPSMTCAHTSTRVP